MSSLLVSTLTLAPACPCGTETAPRRTDASTRATPVSLPSALRAISRCSSDTPAAATSSGWTTISAASPRNSSCALSCAAAAVARALAEQAPAARAGGRRAGGEQARRPPNSSKCRVHPRRSFRYMERGLTVKQTASGRGSGVSYIRDVWNSLLHSLKGTMPDSKSDAKINSLRCTRSC